MDAPSVRPSEPLRALPSMARRETTLGLWWLLLVVEYAVERGGLEGRACRDEVI